MPEQSSILLAAVPDVSRPYYLGKLHVVPAQSALGCGT